MSGDEAKESRVFFVPSNSKFDVTPAEEFGRIVVLEGLRPSPFNTDECLVSAAEQLRNYNYDPVSDFIAFTGPSILVAFVFALAFASNRSVKVLLFDARENGYVERTVQQCTMPDSSLEDSTE